MINNSEPPKDRNFLGHIVTFGWSSDVCQHVKTGMKWEECWWYEGNMYGKPCYTVWCGNDRTTCTGGRVVIEGWVELPE